MHPKNSEKLEEDTTNVQMHIDCMQLPVTMLPMLQSLVGAEAAAKRHFVSDIYAVLE